MDIDIQKNLQDVLGDLPQGVSLVAVSKYHPNEAIQAAYNGGQRIFGESKVQEMTAKYESLPKDITWHFIGHLQTNKVKYIVPYVSLIHAVDSFKLLSVIDEQTAKITRDKIKCLLEIHIAKEETKYGFNFDECREMLEQGEWKSLHHIQIAGIMGMASNVDDENQIRQEFRSLHIFFQDIKQKYFPTDNEFKEISMGMSHDYRIAIQEGSTMVRVGSKIFGERAY